MWPDGLSKSGPIYVKGRRPKIGIIGAKRSGWSVQLKAQLNFVLGVPSCYEKVPKVAEKIAQSGQTELTNMSKKGAK